MNFVIGIVAWVNLQGSVVHSTPVNEYPDILTCQNNVEVKLKEAIEEVGPPPEGISPQIICVDIRKFRT